MNFNPPCILYWVDPFIFSIEKVFVDFPYKEEDGTIYYIEKSGAYLQEFDLFEDLNEARGEAIKRLNDFYGTKMEEIMYTNPKLEDFDLNF